MLNAICIEEKEEWNRVVKSFPHWDVYYLNEYARSLRLHGDGEPRLFYYQNGTARLCFAALLSDVAFSGAFSGLLEPGRYYDMETPYGYGGPLVDGDFSSRSADFERSFRDYCLGESLVSFFIRYHPLLENAAVFDGIAENRYARDTIFMDVADADAIFENMDGKNRNMIRKAERLGVDVRFADWSERADFIAMYRRTMEDRGADEYYAFGDDYFDWIAREMKENAALAYAFVDGRPAAGAIFLFNDEFAHYHLSGSFREFKPRAVGNALLYRAALWASERGVKKLHLGGGTRPNDSLFDFKKRFNRSGSLPFYVGRMIFDAAAYRRLLDVRRAADKTFDVDDGFMIQYRR